MIDQVNTDQIDEAIDSFEESWSLNSRSQIRSLLGRFHLADDSSAITELIRIDIELRYARGVAIQLAEYLDEFGEFLGEPGDIAQIAFEDFRAREAHGHPISSSRWHGLPGIDNESWFRNLGSRRTEFSPAWRAKEVDENFEAALEAIGFHLIHELGRGAFSQVFLATQNDLADRYVVLKIIDQAVSEPHNMAMLQHTNIVPIYSFDRILSRSLICMPYAGRVTMADFLKGQSNIDSRGGECLITTVLNHVHDTVSGADESGESLIPGMATPAAEEHAVLRPLERLRSLGCNELAIWLFQRLAAALAHSHSRGVLHGDLKPANILIRNDGEPALLDFNLSQVLDHKDAKYAGGTLPYMSPETYRVVMGQSIAPHGSSDIYSLGVMLYEFVTGRLPYPTPPSSAAVDIEHAIVARRVPVAWEPDDNVSAGLRCIVQRCLAFEASDRYDSAEQLQQDLDREAKSEPLVFAAESLSSRIKKWLRRHPKFVSGGTVGAVLMAVLIPLVVWAVWLRIQSRHLEAVAMLDAFSHQSTEVLTTAMVDPLRYREETISASLAPLEEFGILGEQGKKAIDAPLLTPAQRLAYRDLIVRHIAQLGFSEIARLRATIRLDKKESVDDEALTRTDKLLAAAEKYQPQSESRALTFLAAERARLAGDLPRYGSLTAQANKLKLESDNEIYLEAVRLMTNRRWAQARDLLTQLADRNSIPSAVRWTSLGRSQYGDRMYEEAKLSFTQSIERAPESSRLRLLRGLCYMQMHDYVHAENDFAEAVTLEPTLISAWVDLAQSRMAQKRFEEAIDDINSALEHSPGHAFLLLLRSRAHNQLGNVAAAKRDYQDAIESENVSATVLVNRSIGRRMRGDYEGALADLDKAQLLDPGSITILNSKARLYVQYFDRIDDAIKLLEEIEAMEPGNEHAIINRAVYHARMGQYPQAKAAMDKALLKPNSAQTLYQAACVHALLPDPKRAIALKYLSMAIQHGYGADSFRTDTDLDSIRDVPGFRAILRTVQLGKTSYAKRKKPEQEAETHNADSSTSTDVHASGSNQ